MGRPYRRLVPVLLPLAVIAGFVGTLAVWLNRQALNTGSWTDTSGRLLADPQVEKALRDYLVKQVFASVNVSGQSAACSRSPRPGWPPH